ncbi:hypothetical protein [Streptomyces eurythermus]
MIEVLRTLILVAAVVCFFLLPAAVIARQQVETHPARPTKTDQTDPWAGDGS